MCRLVRHHGELLQGHGLTQGVCWAPGASRELAPERLDIFHQVLQVRAGSQPRPLSLLTPSQASPSLSGQGAPRPGPPAPGVPRLQLSLCFASAGEATRRSETKSTGPQTHAVTGDRAPPAAPHPYFPSLPATVTGPTINVARSSLPASRCLLSPSAAASWAPWLASWAGVSGWGAGGRGVTDQATEPCDPAALSPSGRPSVRPPVPWGTAGFFSAAAGSGLFGGEDLYCFRTCPKGAAVRQSVGHGPPGGRG